MAERMAHGPVCSCPLCIAQYTPPDQAMSTAGMRVVSHGGGVQTTAMLVLAAQGRIDYQTFLFANVGSDSEHPHTIRYLHELAVPYAEAHGLTIHELRRRRRDGSVETLLDRVMTENTPSIPVRFGADGAPGRRSCTKHFKIEVIRKWLKQNGATADHPATIAFGISVDEIGRASDRERQPYEHIDYPLLDLRMRRDDCEQVIRRAGLPVPHKSDCWFCPFHTPARWQEIRRTDPTQFGLACALEDSINDRRAERGKQPVYLTRFGKPLVDAIPVGQEALFEDSDASCDNGWCMT